MPTSNQAIPDYSGRSWCGGEFAGTIGGFHWSFVLGSCSNGERGGGRWRSLHVWSVCEHIYVSMEFEGEERKKGEGEGHTTVTVGVQRQCVYYTYKDIRHRVL